MKNRIVGWFGIALALFALILAACTASAPVDSPPELPATSVPKSLNVIGPLQVGDMAPDFTLPDSNENMVNLAEELQENEQVVLVFYYFHSCGPCMTQLRDLEKDRAKYEKSGVQVIAIAVQDEGGAEASARSSQADFPILADSDHAVAGAFGVYDLLPEDFSRPHPSVFVINRDRRIVWSYIEPAHFGEDEVPRMACGGERVSSAYILENLPDSN